MSKGVKQALKDIAASIYRDVGSEFAFALDDIRQKVVEEPWFHRAATPETAEFYRWLGPQPGQGPEPGTEAGKGDALGRTAPEPVEVEVMPMEGRPSNLNERVATAEAYARHQEAGPLGTMEMEDIHSHEWRDFAAWIDKGEPELVENTSGGIAMEEPESVAQKNGTEELDPEWYEPELGE